MLLTIQPNSPKPIYEQLILEIKKGIVLGELSPGEGLPGGRVLAADLGINVHTVSKVYRHLEQEQVLARSKGGFIVHPDGRILLSELGKAAFKSKLHELLVDKELHQMSDKEFEEMTQEILSTLRR